MGQSTTYATLKQFVQDNAYDGIGAKDERLKARVIRRALDKLARIYGWSFLRSRKRVITTAPYSTGTVAINDGDTTVTGTGTVFPSDCAGQYMLIDGQLYLIASRDSDTQLTLDSALISSSGSNLSGESYQIIYPHLDLPADFQTLDAVVSLQPVCNLAEKDFAVLQDRMLFHAEVSDPRNYAVEPSASNGTRQLWLEPAPSARRQYEVIYIRRPATPSADSDVIDWDDDALDALEAACLLQLAEEMKNPQQYEMARVMFEDALDNARAGDQKSAGPTQVGEGVKRNSGWYNPRIIIK